MKPQNGCWHAMAFWMNRNLSDNPEKALAYASYHKDDYGFGVMVGKDG